MKLRKRVRRIPEALLVLFARAVIPCISRRGVLRISRTLGTLTYLVSAKLRRVSAANLDLAFGDVLSAVEKRDISKASFQSFCLVLLDLFWFNKNTTARLEQYLRYDKSFEVAFSGDPVIIITAHIGNWEVINLGCGAKGHPLTSVAMPVKNSFADRELNRLREKTGSRISPRSGAIRNVIKTLRDGGGSFFVLDQNTLPNEGGVFVPFFGLSVPVSKAIGALWSRTKATILVAWCVPDQDGYYTVYAKEPLSVPDDETAAGAITARVTSELESVIRDNPNFWLWSYKRWRFYCEGDDPKAFPFYAESFEAYMGYRDLVKTHHTAEKAAADARESADVADVQLTDARAARIEWLRERRSEK